MVKVLLATTIVFFLGTSLSAQSGKQVKPVTSKTDLKFLDISVQAVNIPAATDASATKIENIKQEMQPQFASKKESAPETKAEVENASTLQFKYSQLLDVEVEMIKNLNLFKVIDEWLGTHYRYGGTSKSGIDCSAFMQVLFTALYGISLPRTARDQFNFTRRVSRTELREGDLVFFNTRGGVSHVGMYLANNKFVHASVSGVTISSLFDDYYARRLIGVGRLDAIPGQTAMLTPNP